MLDAIGRAANSDDRRREATSLLVTASLCIAAVGFWTGVAAFRFAEAPIAMPLDVMPNPIELALENFDRTPPSLPKAAPAIQRGVADDVVATATPEPDPDVTPDTLTEPKESLANQVGHEAGTDDGDPNGKILGSDRAGEGECVDDCGQGDSDAVSVHSTDLQWIRRPNIVFPRAAVPLGIEETVCRADVVFADSGVPRSVTIRGCPAVFHQGAESAILKSKIRPFKAEGQRVTIKTSIVVRYVLR